MNKWHKKCSLLPKILGVKWLPAVITTGDLARLILGLPPHWWKSSMWLRVPLSPGYSSETVLILVYTRVTQSNIFISVFAFSCYLYSISANYFDSLVLKSSDFLLMTSEHSSAAVAHTSRASSFVVLAPCFPAVPLFSSAFSCLPYSTWILCILCWPACSRFLAPAFLRSLLSKIQIYTLSASKVQGIGSKNQADLSHITDC